MLPASILIVCTSFPPLNRTSARRPYYLARELRDRGHNVSVLTSEETSSADWNVDIEGMTIVRYPRTHIQRDMSGWQRAIARALQRSKGGRIHRLLLLLADITLPLDHGDRWDITPQEVEQRIGRPGIVVSTCPLWSIPQFGMLLAKAWNSTFILDYRDPWGIVDPTVYMDIVSVGGTNLLRRTAFKRQERRIGQAAYALTAVSEPVLKNAQAVTGNHRGAAFIGGYVPNLDQVPKGPNTKFTVAYTGRLYSEQDWDLVLDAIDRMNLAIKDLGRCFTLRLVGAKSSDSALLERVAEAARRTGAVEILPRTTRENALLEQRQADALLHPTFRGRRGFLPVKFLEYLGADRPILLVTRENDLMEEIVTATRTGVLIPDAKTLAELLMARLEEWKAGRTWTISPDREELRGYEYSARMRPWASQIITWDNERRSTETTGGGK